MIETGVLLQIQRLRHARDLATGDADRPMADRLKLRGLELTGLLGRLARLADPDGMPEVVTDILMATAGAANLMRIDLSRTPIPAADASDPLMTLADPVGRLCDACEKIDHLEEFAAIARSATIDLAGWILATAHDARIDAPEGSPRRVVLRLADEAPYPRAVETRAAFVA